MSRPQPVARARRVLVLAVLTVLALAAFAGVAVAKNAKFHRGGLPSIGEISLHRTPSGRAVVSVPVTYTKALTGPSRGLESSLVILRVGSRLVHGRPVGKAIERAHRHRLDGTVTIVDRFPLSAEKSRWLLDKSPKQRGRLIRVTVQHLIKKRAGQKPLHQKDAAQTMASSHRAKAQGQSIELTLRNDTQMLVRNASVPVMCMYTEGEEGSYLEAFSNGNFPIAPGETIEAEIEADGSIFDEAEYQGPSGASAGAYFEWLGIAADVIAYSFEYELTPLTLGFDIASDCDAVASTFSFVAASDEREGLVLRGLGADRADLPHRLPVEQPDLRLRSARLPGARRRTDQPGPLVPQEHPAAEGVRRRLVRDPRTGRRQGRRGRRPPFQLDRNG
jgi:hypothetical protein